MAGRRTKTGPPKAFPKDLVVPVTIEMHANVMKAGAAAQGGAAWVREAITEKLARDAQTPPPSAEELLSQASALITRAAEMVAKPQAKRRR